MRAFRDILGRKFVVKNTVKTGKSLCSISHYCSLSVLKTCVGDNGGVFSRLVERGI